MPNIHIETQNGNVDYVAGKGERLLYAGLRSGWQLPYACASGTCGECRAQVIEGDAADLWPEAPAHKHLRRSRNEILLCQSAACADIRLRLPRSPPIAGYGEAVPRSGSAVVNSVRHLTPDVAEIVLGLDEPMCFEAGQFVLIEFPEIQGYRAYSMVNAEESACALTFVIRKKPGGGVSDWLFRADRSGTRVRLFGPLGKAIFEPGMAHVICIAGGSGVAGMVAIAKRAIALPEEAVPKVDIYFGVRNPSELFYPRELSQIKELAPDHVRITVAFSEAGADMGLSRAFPDLNFDTGYVHDVALRAITKDSAAVATAFLAGPPVAVDAAIRSLVSIAGFKPAQIRFDRFA